MMLLRISLSGLLLVSLGCGAEHGKRRSVSGQNLPYAEVVQPTFVEVLPRRIKLTATVEPMNKIDICARVPGVVNFLPDYVDIGYQVKQGEKLIALEVADLAAQKAHKETLLDLAISLKQQVIETRKVLAKEVEEAKFLEKRYEAEYNGRGDDYERTIMLVKRDAQSPDVAQEKLRLKEAAHATWRTALAQIETKKAKLDATTIDEQVAESKIKVARAEIQNLTALVEYATITAPFPGVVTKRWVDRGATIKDASTPLLTIMRLDRVRVLIDVPDRDAAQLSTTEQNPNENGKGDPVMLRFQALFDKGEEAVFNDFIMRKAEVRDTMTRTMRAEIHLANKLGWLQPGMFGTASILLEERLNALTIPSSALIRRGDGYDVLSLTVASGDTLRGVVKPLRVQPGYDDGTQVEIISGITRDTWIVVKRSSVIAAGDEVVGVPYSRK